MILAHVVRSHSDSSTKCTRASLSKSHRALKTNTYRARKTSGSISADGGTFECLLGPWYISGKNPIRTYIGKCGLILIHSLVWCTCLCVNFKRASFKVGTVVLCSLCQENHSTYFRHVHFPDFPTSTLSSIFVRRLSCLNLRANIRWTRCGK